jgi:hypothetical protein
MDHSEPIYYLRAVIEANGRFSPPSVLAPEVMLVAHFYIRADSQPTAGAVAHDFCRMQGLTFAEYICLPNPMTRAMVDENEDEHVRAFELAERKGEAVVISVVLGELPT